MFPDIKDDVHLSKKQFDDLPTVESIIVCFPYFNYRNNYMMTYIEPQNSTMLYRKRKVKIILYYVCIKNSAPLH